MVAKGESDVRLPVFAPSVPTGAGWNRGAIRPRGPGLRADEQDEWNGMDSSESGERGYIHTDIESSSGGTAHA